MGTKNGFWVPCYLSFEDHEKTARLAASLTLLGVPESYAIDVAWGQWKRLAGWLVNQGIDGRLLSITPRAFAHIVRWDDVRKAKGLWDAWMESGFIDEPGTERARLHDFRDAFAHVLDARERSAKRRDEKRSKRANDSEEVREQFANGPRTEREQSAKSSGPCVRASRPDRTGPDHRTPTESIPAAASPGGPLAGPPVGFSTADEPPRPPKRRAPRRAAARNGDALGPPAAPSGTSGASAALLSPPRAKAPTVDLCAAWVEAARSAGYPAVAVNGQHAKTLADLWRAAGEDLEAVTRAVGAFFADRDPFTVKNGHSIGEFGRTSARWLAVAAGTAPAAEMAGSIRSGGATALLFGDES